MILRTIPVGMIQANCYIVGCEETLEAAVIDPGGDGGRILREVHRHGLTVRYVLLTHAHFDHIAASAEVVGTTEAKLAVHASDREMFELGGGAQLFGLPVQSNSPPDVEVGDGDKVTVGRLCFQVHSIPGHSPGGVAYYEAQQGVVFVGDVLFAGGIGRYDLPGGELNTLFRSIRGVLFSLPGETIVYPGHGPATTIAREKAENPFVAV